MTQLIYKSKVILSHFNKVPSLLPVELKLLKTHPLRHLHVGQFLLIVERGRPLLFLGFVWHIAVNASLTLTLI